MKHILFQIYFSVKQTYFTLKQNMFNVFLQFLKIDRIFTILIFFLGSFQIFPIAKLKRKEKKKRLEIYQK